MSNKYYVYALLDLRKPGKYVYGKYSFDYEPFYIGKGCGDRARTHFSWIARLGYDHKRLHKKKRTNPYRINKIIKIHRETGNYPIIHKICKNVNEIESLKLEAKLISLIGRENKGPLVNATDGGESPTGNSGWRHSKESNLKNSESNKIAYEKRSVESKVSANLKRSKTHKSKSSKQKAELSKINRKSVEALWNSSKEKIEQRNANVKQAMLDSYANLDEGRRLANIAIRALGSVLKTLNLSDKDRESFKSLMVKRIRKYYSNSKHHKYPWSHVKLKVYGDYEKVLVGAIVL